MTDASRWIDAIRQIHASIRDAVVASCEAQAVEALAQVVEDEAAGDTIFAIDRVSEARLVELLASQATASEPIVLVAEGLAGGQMVLPRGAGEADAAWRLLVDPIDGTRGLMYQKRSAWILTGVARNRGTQTRLSNIEIAVQTEIPLVKQHLCDQLWAQRGQGVQAERFDRLSRQTRPLSLHPSRARDLRHGFAAIARFFPGGRDVLAAIDDEVVLETVGPSAAGKALCFEDQYVSTGGQLYELMAGHDRFLADIRPLLGQHAGSTPFTASLCCHPYDLATMLIAQELGVILTDARGEPLDAPLDIDADVSWVGYANDELRLRIAPALRAALRKRGLI